MFTHRCKLALAGVLAAAAATCGPAPKPADADRVDLSLGSSNRYLHSSSIDSVSGDDTHSMFSIDVGWELNQVRLPLVELVVDARFETGGFDGATFQRMASHTGVNSGMLGARARWDASGITGFFARAAIGLTHVSLELRDAAMSDAPYLADDRLSASTYVGGGMDIVPLRAMRQGEETFGFGLRFEGGYFASTPVSMRAIPRGTNTADDAILIPAEEADLGSLNVSAWVARVALVARY